ncbi:hypothetical protein BKK52_01260 [Rodentibacter trehalosifermentans]|uniref:DUF1778 domain-containing protein n=2 Tax=Rodentibacter TaxID=1960084 RepID=A0A4S2Q373_9PAST|nr:MULTISPECIES: DUF1778 domain-containing protein [Rodentibacter]OOF50805.1 hypothetical protein BKK52_01260 [Rodentibacter trehalosifermentans]THA11000.1 DUF1778 domain-containing protein [Rodentibacter pneumotropicus]
MTIVKFTIQINQEIHSRLKQAASIEGCNLSDFIINSALSVAKKTVEQNDILHLTINDQMLFATSLIEPPDLNLTMKEALHLSDELLRE